MPAGCSRPPSSAVAVPSSAASAPMAQGESAVRRATEESGAATPDPRQTLQRAIELRAAHKYRELAPLLVVERADTAVRCLMAVDHFLTANRSLCNWIRDHAGIGLSQTVDQAYVAEDLGTYAGDGLGVFGLNIELLDMTIDGDAASVSFAGSAVDAPVRRARLTRSAPPASGGSPARPWRLDPGSACADPLPAAFEDLARGLELALSDFETGRVTADELRGDPEVLVEKIRAHLRHGVNTLSKATAAARPTETKPR